VRASPSPAGIAKAAGTVPLIQEREQKHQARHWLGLPQMSHESRCRHSGIHPSHHLRRKQQGNSEEHRAKPYEQTQPRTENAGSPTVMARPSQTVRYAPTSLRRVGVPQCERCLLCADRGEHRMHRDHADFPREI
jgi:hypothetical protein